MTKKIRFLALILAVAVLASTVLVFPAYSADTATPAFTNPFQKDLPVSINGETVTNRSFRIPSMVSLDDGTIVAAADLRWNTTYDGGGLDTLVARSTDNGATWTYDAVNYLGDNGNVYNGAHSTAFLDPCLAVGADGKTVYMLVDLYPYGVALNGLNETHTQPVKTQGFDANGNLLLRRDNEYSYSYYLKDGKIYSVTNGTEVSGYTVDGLFNVTDSNNNTTNLFCEDSPFEVVRTGYLYLRTSKDGGITWENPILLPLKTASEKVCLVAPGSSITTSDGTVIFPVYSYYGDNDPAGNTQRLSFIYSDDGINWQRSPELNYNWASEAAVVELNSGVLRFFFRNGKAKLCYVDYGKNGWGSPVVMSNVATNSNTQISAVSYSRTLEGKQVILVSCPTGSNRLGSNSSSGSARLNGSIFVFTVNGDDTLNLENTIPVNSGNHQFMYSCMAEREDGSIAILYEDNENGWGVGDNCYYTMNTACYTAENLGVTLDQTRRLVDDDTNVTVEGDGIPFGVTFDADLITDPALIEQINRNIGKDIYSDSAEEDQILNLDRPALIYSLNFINNRSGEEVQPVGTVTVTAPVSSLGIAEGDDCVIYHLHDDGSVDCGFFAEKDGTVSFETDAFSFVQISKGVGGVYNVSSFYDVSSESISGNGQFTAAGVFFTDDGHGHVLIGGAFNTSNVSKINEVLLDGNSVSFTTQTSGKTAFNSIRFYDGSNSSSTLIFEKSATSTKNTDWIDIDLGDKVDIGEYFTFKVVTGTGGGQEGVAFNFGIYVTAELDYSVEKTVYKVGDTLVNAKTARGVKAEEVIFRIDAINGGDVEVTNARLEDTLPEGFFDVSTVQYSKDLVNWTDATVNGLTFDIPVGTLEAESTQTYYVRVRTLNTNIPDGTYTNNVTLLSDEGIDPKSSADLTMSVNYSFDKVVYSVNGEAPTATAGSTDASKSAQVKAGDKVIYKITIGNEGSNALSGVTLNEELPIGAYVNGTGTVLAGTSVDGMTAVTVSMNKFTVASDITIPAGGQAVYYVSTTVPNDVKNGTYFNGAVMNVTVGGSDLSFKDSASVTVPEILNYSITKSVIEVNGEATTEEVPDVYPGQDVIFEITVENEGNSDLTGTQILENLPACATNAMYGTDKTNWISLSNVIPAGVEQDGVYTVPDKTSYTYYVKITVDPNTSEEGVQTNVAEFAPEGKTNCSDSASINIVKLITNTSLTICKTGHEDVDPNQTFIFRLTGDGTDVTVTVHGNGSTVIDGLNVSVKYTVTELTDWSWRYTNEGVDTSSGATTVEVTSTSVENGAEIILGESGNKITFTNNRDNIYWLDGDSWCNNIFK